MLGKKGGEVESKKKDVVIVARLLHKHGVIKWNDPDNENRLVASYPKKSLEKREEEEK